MSPLSASGGQSIGVSASASVLPMNTQDWSPLGWTGWISLQSKGLSRVFSNTQFKSNKDKILGVATKPRMDWFLPSSLTWSYRTHHPQTRPPTPPTDPRGQHTNASDTDCLSCPQRSPASLYVQVFAYAAPLPETFRVSPAGLNSAFKAQLWCQFLGEAPSDSIEQSRTPLTPPGHQVCLHTACPLTEARVCVALPQDLLLVQLFCITPRSLALHTAGTLWTYTQ